MVQIIVVRKSESSRMKCSYTEEHPYLATDRHTDREKGVAPGCRKTDLQMNNNNLHTTLT